MAKKYLCIHGHFYQPPRENPWLEAIEIQDSAAPFHNWNERITRECYGPNARARLVDGEGKIINLLNNYAWMSFNFGPTLLAWMADAAPEVVARIVEGDRLSRERRRGHGNAMAQVYNHVIMPLASALDKKTQVLWGIADFRLRFGREPEGMWLAETAADIASLEALAEAGIRFTVLAPRQAKRWSPLGKNEWTEAAGEVDPSRAYRCNLPSGRSIAIFFYDGAISQAVAFEKLLDHGEKFLDRLRNGFDPGREHDQLAHIATDGESYGHHHAYGDMALAFVLEQLEKDPDIQLTNYGEFLELHPPEWEVEIHDNSSWSCVHGVERWRSNCGCNSGRPGWQQEWRAPLRKAFDWLKERVDQLLVDHGKRCFRDPWAARDGYIDVILQRNPETITAFFEKHRSGDLNQETRHVGLWLMEMQRHAMLMYTSCGWFFDEISGLETVQCLRYAARAIQLARHFDQDFEADFVKQLEAAPSNIPEFGNGRAVWERLIRPGRIDLERVLAHHAIGVIYRDREERNRVYCYDLETLDQQVASRGASNVALGRFKVRSRITESELVAEFLVIHFSGVDFHAVLRKAPPVDKYDALKKKLFDVYETGSLADVTALATEEFNGEVYRLSDLFVEEQRRVIGIILKERFTEYRLEFERLANPDEDVIFHLGQMHYPLPRGMRTAISVALDHRIADAAANLESEENVKRIQSMLERGKAWDYQPDRPMLMHILARQLKHLTEEFNPVADLAALARHIGAVLDVASMLQIDMDLWQAQNRLLDACPSMDAATRAKLQSLAERFRIHRQLLGWEP
ncbi:MAG TPA: DUF3536 domain-containing protein [Gemmataceae bacterium]|nr:DUF3536 domain-containing protein [Gemmataceae bacterium]